MTSQELQENLKDRFPGKVLEVRQPVPDKTYMVIKPEDVVTFADYVFHTLGARFVISAGIDTRPLNGKLGVYYIFSFDKDKLFLCLQTYVDPDNPVIDSITPKIPGANWAEREFQDLVGIKLRGHPDPRRLVLADDWPEGLHPLCKDFPYNYHPPSDPSAKPQLKEPPEGATVLPVGPFYPVLEEPAYFRLFVEGETIVGCDYRGFYNHRGIEKLGESALTYNQIVFLAERI